MKRLKNVEEREESGEGEMQEKVGKGKEEGVFCVVKHRVRKHDKCYFKLVDHGGRENNILLRC